MVTEALLGVAVTIAAWIVTSIPFPAPPDWFTVSEDGLAYLSDALGAASFWLPLPLAGAIFVAYLAVHAGALLVKLARQVLSYLTLGGGAT